MAVNDLGALVSVYAGGENMKVGDLEIEVVSIDERGAIVGYVRGLTEKEILGMRGKIMKGNGKGWAVNSARKVGNNVWFVRLIPIVLGRREEK